MIIRRFQQDAEIMTITSQALMMRKKFLHPEAYRYAVRALMPIQFPVQVVLMYMVQCGDYVLSPEFISNFKKVDASQAEVLWETFHNPRSCTLEMIRTLIFNACSWDSRRAPRYFIAGYVPAPSFVSSNASSTQDSHEPGYIRVQRIIAESNVDLLSTEAQPLEGDFVQLPEDEPEEIPTVSYTLDHERGEDFRSMECPMDVEEALCLVRRVRDGRFNMVSAMNQDESATIENDDDDLVIHENGFLRVM